MSETIFTKQINLHHCKAATFLIGNKPIESQTKNQKHIILAQEPWSNCNKIKGIDENNFALYYKYDANIRLRAFIVTTKNIAAVQLPQFCMSDVTTIKISTCTNKSNEKILICGMYAEYMPFDQNNTVPDHIIRKVVDSSEQSGIPIVIDANFCYNKSKGSARHYTSNTTIHTTCETLACLK